MAVRYGRCLATNVLTITVEDESEGAGKAHPRARETREVLYRFAGLLAVDVTNYVPRLSLPTVWWNFSRLLFRIPLIFFSFLFCYSRRVCGNPRDECLGFLANNATLLTKPRDRDFIAQLFEWFGSDHEGYVTPVS